jgi:DNA-binding MarR family transcriptional regulator
MSNEEVGVKNLLGYKLKKTQHALRLHMDAALKSLDLTTPQYSVLAQLELKPGASNAALARSAFITAQSMHGIISTLEKRGFIQRSSPHGRIIGIELTLQGFDMVKQAHDVIRDVESRMLRTINTKHQLILEKLLLECFNNLES